VLPALTPPFPLPRRVPAPDVIPMIGKVWTDVLLGPPGQTVAILLVALITRLVIHRLVSRIAEGIASGRAGLGRLDQHLANATAMLSVTPVQSARREQRARTMATALNGVTTGVVTAVAVLTVLPLYGIPIAPLLTSAGILGVALGFGAQTLVKDFLSGIFMIAEDQYGVGDVVDLGEATGVVESVGLRVTRLRDVDGTVWYLRNGEVLRVGNRSQGWSRAVLDVGIAYGEDVGRVQDLLLDVAAGLQREPDYAPLVLEDPQVWGIESVSADAVVVRLVVKTVPLKQWDVARELRRRIKDRFDAEGVRVAYSSGSVGGGGRAAGPTRP
jgi:moderate conductance mechanosensitive channel